MFAGLLKYHEESEAEDFPFSEIEREPVVALPACRGGSVEDEVYDEGIDVKSVKSLGIGCTHRTHDQSLSFKLHGSSFPEGLHGRLAPCNGRRTAERRGKNADCSAQNG